MPQIVRIPKYFDGPSMSRIAADVCGLISSHGVGCEITFDFSRLGFVRPAGIVFLTNLSHWLKAKGCSVSFLKPVERSDACVYLDDAEFFLEHCGARLWEDSRVRSTSLPVQLIRQEQIHHWLTSKLIPWLTGRLGVSASGYPI